MAKLTGKKKTDSTPDPSESKVETIRDHGLNAVETVSRFTDFDIHLFRQGKHFKLYEKLGSHVMDFKGVTGTYFAVWAPNASYISVTGNFNGWNQGAHALAARWDSSGIWEGWIPNIGVGEVYKYYIVSQTGEAQEKSDPFALWCEVAPRTASIVWDTWYEWGDSDWMKVRKEKNKLNAPISVYEVHLGSWQRDPADPERFLTYKEIAVSLVPYVKEMGFTHVELMPIMEHPYPPSWGYQITGYFSCASRMGTPQELMYLIDQLHQAGVGVYVDWVPSHFPGDAHGLFRFDGTSLYEHEDPRKGYHPDWKSYIFNYGRNEVKSFLISNAIFWLDRYHTDGLRVDAVASMLYLDYSRKHGEWIPNEFGGRENLEAIALLREMNVAAYTEFPDIQTIAEESTAFPGVSRPVFVGGLGFGMKWMMGWMNDTLKYFEKDSAFRKWHQDQLTFSLVYAFSENYMLPFSHDEVVYGKKSLINKMPGDEWQKFANLRLMFAYMFTHPGTKLMFMGCEFGQTSEWAFQQSLDWHLLDNPMHKGMKDCVTALNKLYKTEPALYDFSFSHDGFEWIDTQDRENSVLVFARKGLDPNQNVVVVLNLTPIPRLGYRVGVLTEGIWQEIFNSDQAEFQGSGVINSGPVTSEAHQWHGKSHSVILDLPPMGAIVLKKNGVPQHK
ncbi:1,4-alpha-glucan branching protein GlgB [Dyadobacter chenwenxiniae]|uniref:1,4-alpha-glucan branching enzyme GlgB n=1 Tax=Dyadobacter chenwenxiniae TaxID=2906456 RepID=A0A9X1PMD8_9BACT|nr:1,4-alpha-glucan branching protein GlgB [Dyadobacter chenwenxiniae]MCF0062223.1 1,4-alpha-glucan branching protein GlgB [Dyadobacter chenwenxiniae]UON84021.1 1,4-alpha-glucan branching protein GlgB [Dyadobacter chenwenxiniae]